MLLLLLFILIKYYITKKHNMETNNYNIKLNNNIIKNIYSDEKFIFNPLNKDKMKFLFGMQEDAKRSLQAKTKENFHRTQSFKLPKEISLNQKKPFWVKSWSYNEDKKPHRCWKNFPLILHGVKFKSNLNLVPFISKFLDETGSYRVAGLSLLPPGCKIDLHEDNDHFEDIACHIPLLTNNESKLLVNGKYLSLADPGKITCFNDSYEHSSVNFGLTDRITLYLQK